MDENYSQDNQQISVEDSIEQRHAKHAEYVEDMRAIAGHENDPEKARAAAEKHGIDKVREGLKILRIGKGHSEKVMQSVQGEAPSTPMDALQQHYDEQPDQAQFDAPTEQSEQPHTEETMPVGHTEAVNPTHESDTPALEHVSDVPVATENQVSPQGEQPTEEKDDTIGGIFKKLFGRK